MITLCSKSAAFCVICGFFLCSFDFRPKTVLHFRVKTSVFLPSTMKAPLKTLVFLVSWWLKQPPGKCSKKLKKKLTLLAASGILLAHTVTKNTKHTDKNEN